MTIPWDSLKNIYNDQADELIETINAAELTLYYKNPILTSVTNSPVPSGILDAYNSQSFIENLHNRISEGGAGYQQSVLSETIKVRSYWNSVNSKFPVDLRDNLNVVQINSYTTDQQKLLNASYAQINGYKIKMIRDPIPYGFCKRYSISFWERIV